MTYIAKPVKMNIYVKLNLHMFYAGILFTRILAICCRPFQNWPNASQKEKAPLEELCTNENTSTPWVQNINDFCNNCSARAPIELKPCPICFVVKYCSKKCQVNDQHLTCHVSDH